MGERIIELATFVAGAVAAFVITDLVVSLAVIAFRLVASGTAVPARRQPADR